MKTDIRLEKGECNEVVQGSFIAALRVVKGGGVKIRVIYFI